jgi:hypothetical protein
MVPVNCPTCGAKTSSIVANCEYCQVELRIEAAAAIAPQEFIGALVKSLEASAQVKATGIERLNPALATSRAKAEVIERFPIPSSLNHLTHFFLFCHGNCKSGMHGTALDAIAWKAKAKAAYEGLRLAALNDAQLTGFLVQFDKVYGSASEVKGVRGFLRSVFGL